MKILKFALSGRTAFFKKPEANSYFYFTYGHIHKVALLGIFGAVLGYKGYSGGVEFSKKKLDLSPGYPEFYERLQSLKVSVVPHSKTGMFHKKIQSFNNSVGYASKEQGGNLIVKEQWLEEPGWDVYLLVDNEEAEKIAEAILNSRCVYQPYLGKNDHTADIFNVSLEMGEVVQKREIRIHSFADKEKIDIIDDFEEEEVDGAIFKYEEFLPVSLDEKTNLYGFRSFVLTNIPAHDMKDDVYEVNGKNIMFY